MFGEGMSDVTPNLSGRFTKMEGEFVRLGFGVPLPPSLQNFGVIGT